MTEQLSASELAAHTREWYGIRSAARYAGVNPRTFNRWVQGQSTPGDEPLYRLEGMYEAGKILVTTIPAAEVTHWLSLFFPELDRTLDQLLADPTAIYNRYWRSQVGEHARILADIAAHEHGSPATPRAPTPTTGAAERFLELLHDEPPVSGIRYRNDRLLLQVTLAIDHARAVAFTHGQDFPYTARAIGYGLVQLGLVQPDESGKTQTIARINGRTVRVWDLPNDAI